MLAFVVKLRIVLSILGSGFVLHFSKASDFLFSNLPPPGWTVSVGLVFTKRSSDPAFTEGEGTKGSKDKLKCDEKVLSFTFYYYKLIIKDN